MKKKELKSEELLRESLNELKISKSADTTAVQQFISSSSVADTKKKTAYADMLFTELIQTIYKQQKSDFQVKIICQRLAIFDDRSFCAESKFSEFSKLHI